MGRPQTFETAAVVRAARGVFWRDGYESASLPDLEEATGLSRSSIYHAFGSKRGLFDAAVTSYLDEVIRPRLRPLTATDVEPEAVVRYLVGLREALDRPGSLPSTSGCLLINVAGAPVGRDEAVREVVAAYRAELGSALARGVAAHRPDRPEVEQRRLAQTLTGLVVAALAVVRVDQPAALRLLDTAIEVVEDTPSGEPAARPREPRPAARWAPGTAPGR